MGEAKQAGDCSVFFCSLKIGLFGFLAGYIAGLRKPMLHQESLDIFQSEERYL
jgi:hypothetical protein